MPHIHIHYSQRFEDWSVLVGNIFYACQYENAECHQQKEECHLKN